MPIEAATYISQLDASKPDGDVDTKSEGDDLFRLLKSVLQAQFPNLGAAAVTPTAAQLNDVANKAVKTGDTYTGTHDFTGATVNVTTQTAGDSSTKPASTAFVQTAFAAIAATSLDLIVAVESGTSVTGLAGYLHVLTNASATTVATPSSPTVGQRFGVLVANGRTDNVIAYGSEKIGGLAESCTINRKTYVGVVFRYVNADLGWVLSA